MRRMKSGVQPTEARLRAGFVLPAARGLAALLLLLVLGGCAQLVPQTIALRTGWPSGVPQSVENTAIPFFPQDEYQCGPAALATVLADSGLQVTPEQLVGQVWIPERKGSLQLEMLAASRRHDRVAYVLAPRYADMLREVAAGNPVIVLQDVGLAWTQWHYAVVAGFDYPSGSIFLRSGTRKRENMPFTAFERSWMASGYWAMVAMPPDKIPASATEDAWMNAVLAMARVADKRAVRTAFATALRRWPDNQVAAIGLANQLHASGELAQADTVLREAHRRHPQSTIIANNLAQVLSDLGRQQEALAIIEPVATDSANPFAADVRSTRELILERMKKAAAAQRR
jgi:tetratricopeptide (TPR) repeat protein